MKPGELAQHQRLIEDALRFGKSLDEGRPERALVARHVCVLASGFIENVVRVQLTKLSSDSKPRVELRSYIESTVGRFQNPEFQRILDLTGKFSATWREKLDQIDDSIKSAVNSVVGNRHLIAHGRTSSISLAQIEQYMNLLKEFAKQYARICK